MAFVPLKDDLHKKILDLFLLKFHLDQVLHTVVYFLICIYFIIGERLGLHLFNVNTFKKFILIVIFLAILSECVQLFVPYRSFNFFDMLANLIGIGIGIVVIIPFVRIRRQ